MTAKRIPLPPGWKMFVGDEVGREDLNQLGEMDPPPATFEPGFHYRLEFQQPVSARAAQQP